MALPGTTVVLYKLDDGHGQPIVDATGDSGNNLTPNTVPGNPTSMDFSIFLNRADGSQAANAVLDAMHIFSPGLTSAQRDAVHNSGNGLEYASFDAATQAKVLASYGLGEASAASSFADSSANGRTLTVQGVTLLQAAGKVGNAQDNVTLPVSYAWRSATGMSNGGLSDWEVDFWVKLNALAPASGDVHAFAAVADLANSKFFFSAYYNRHGADASGRFQFDWGSGVANDLANNAVVWANTFGAPSAATWYHINARFVYADNTIYIRVNNGADDSITPVAQPTEVSPLISTGNAARFESGYTADGGPGYDLSGVHYAAKSSPGTDLKFVNGAAKWGGVWVKLSSTIGNQCLAGIYDSGDARLNWLLQFSAGDWYFIVSTGAAGGTLEFALVAANDTNTHLLMFGYRTSDNKLWISKDNGTAVEANKTVTIGAPAIDFLMGGCHNGANKAQQLKGTIDGLFLADGEATTAEKDAVWNSGSGTETLVSGDVVPVCWTQYRRRLAG